MISREPIWIIRPFTWFFGIILDLVFNFVNAISPTEASILGIAIILMTIIARAIMLPLAISGHKSMAKTQKLTASPEMERINKKYEGKKDPESQNKKRLEVSELYKKHNVKPLMGCLPSFIQMPIFIGLYYVMNQSYMFISKLSSLYNQIATMIVGLDDGFMALYNVGFKKIPKNMVIDTSNVSDVMRLINRFKLEDWNAFLEQIPYENRAGILELLERKNSIEQLFTLSLTENSGFSWPIVIIPILAVVTSFLSSYFMSKRQVKSDNPNAQMQQKLMLYGMPLFMGFITLGMPAGVGLYWIVGNIVQVFQQIAFNKFLTDDKKIDKSAKTR